MFYYVERRLNVYYLGIHDAQIATLPSPILGEAAAGCSCLAEAMQF